MPENIKDQESAIIQDDSSYGIKIEPTPIPEKQIGIDTKNVFMDNVVEAIDVGKVDISKIESFSTISQTRDTMYTMLDTMAEDNIISAVLETYAEDATERNDKGQIVWCESSDANIAKYVTFLLNSMNVDKNIYKWVYSLCKYGDVYLRLYRTSEFEDALFADDIQKKKEDKKKQRNLSEALEELNKEKEHEILKEDININLYHPNDNFVHYLEMVSNPAEMFELTKFGKTYAYIQAMVSNSQARDTDQMLNAVYRYSFKKKDIDVYDAVTFVHAALEDNTSRVPEEVDIFLPIEKKNEDGTYNNEYETKLTYNVRRGQSLLYSSYKIWREMKLLENAMLLNRITKSSVIRVFQVEVGDMGKDQVGPYLNRLKQMIEQKTAINTGNTMSEYTNPGPMENSIYVPTHNGQGSLSIQAVGGDVDVKGLADIDYFTNLLFGGLRVPKTYFSFVDDAAGFSGGESLALISSRYAKMVKRIQNTMIQALTDAINIMLLDKGLDSYINKFELQMVTPTTSEERDRRETMSNRINYVRDTMDLLQDIEDSEVRLRILKALLSNALQDNEITELIQEEIEKLEDGQVPNTESEGDDFDLGGGSSGLPSSSLDDFGSMDLGGDDLGDTDLGEDETLEPVDNTLPSPADLGQDFTDNNAEF